MNYASYETLVDNIREWSRQLPEYDAFVGVPRSGLLPASLLALCRNVRLVDLQPFLQNPEQAVATAPLRGNNPAVEKPTYGRVLVVDDTCSEHSATMTWLRERVPRSRLEVEYGAVYRASPESRVDRCFRTVPQPRLFEWNWRRHHYLHQAILDIDGVLCEEWMGREQDSHDPAYAQHLRQARPLHLPERWVLGVCTSRLEKYRPQTEWWLRQHGVAYQNLWMYPGKLASERRRRGDQGRRKAEIYRTSEAVLFVESSRQQAVEIVKTAGKPVLCTDVNRMFLP